MRILLICAALNGGGSERFSITLFQYFKERQKDIRLLTCVNSIEYSVSPEFLVDYETLNKKKSILSVFSLWRYLKKVKPDTVISVSFRVSQILLFFCLFPTSYKLVVRLPCILSQEKFSKIERFIARFLFKKSLSKVIVVCQSEAMKKDFLEYFKLSDHQNVYVINNPVSFIRGEVFESKLGSSEKLKIIYVGRLHYIKGVDRLFHALALVKRPWELIILGQGPSQQELMNLSKTLKIDSNITWKGFVKDLKKYYTSADVMVLPSRSEGFPNVVLEAGSFGCPIIAFDARGGVAESLGKNGVRGILIPDGRCDLFAKAIDDFQPFAYDRRKISDEVRRDFSPEIIFSQYENIIQQAWRD